MLLTYAVFEILKKSARESTRQLMQDIPACYDVHGDCCKVLKSGFKLCADHEKQLNSPVK